MEIFRLKKSRDILSLNMRNIVMINDQTTQASNTTSICHGEIKSSLVRKEDSARIIFIRSHLLVMRKNNMHSFLTFLLLSLFLFIFSGYPFFFFCLDLLSFSSVGHGQFDGHINRVLILLHSKGTKWQEMAHQDKCLVACLGYLQDTNALSHSLRL